MMSTSKNKPVTYRYEENRGRFIKPCPGTPRYVCCGYRIINFAQGCTIGCTYCILDHYFDSDTPVLFSNVEQLIGELRKTVANSKGILRFGTGEFTDSLLHDDYYHVYRRILPLIASSSNAVLEIKTKTVNIGTLINMDLYNRIILSWSLNSDYIASREERGAPCIEERISAAYRVETCGYKLAFHFDPVVFYDGWEEGYKKTIEALFHRIDPQNVVYVSMGSLRFSSDMQDSLMQRSDVYLHGDFIRGQDGKIRYFRPIRTKLYRTVLAYLKQYIPEERVYLCMENQDVWKDVFVIDNMTSAQLAKRLDRACVRAFPGLISKQKAFAAAERGQGKLDEIR